MPLLFWQLKPSITRKDPRTNLNSGPMSTSAALKQPLQNTSHVLTLFLLTNIAPGSTDFIWKCFPEAKVYNLGENFCRSGGNHGNQPWVSHGQEQSSDLEAVQKPGGFATVQLWRWKHPKILLEDLDSFLINWDLGAKGRPPMAKEQCLWSSGTQTKG